MADIVVQEMIREGDGFLLLLQTFLLRLRRPEKFWFLGDEEGFHIARNIDDVVRTRRLLVQKRIYQAEGEN